jgi:hypothetical protein
MYGRWIKKELKSPGINRIPTCRVTSIFSLRQFILPNILTVYINHSLYFSVKLFLSYLIILSFSSLNSFSQEFVYPNKLFTDQGLLENRPYSIEEAQEFESQLSPHFVPWIITDWGEPRKIADQEDGILYAQLLAIGDTLLCAYSSMVGHQSFFVRTMDGGGSWDPFITLGDSAIIRRHYYTEIVSHGANIITGSSVWDYGRMGANLMYFKSTDYGASWSNYRTVFGYYRNNQTNYASFTNSGDTLYFAYNEYDRDSIYVVRSTDWGVTWNGRGVNVAYLSQTSQNMGLRASGSNLHLVWVQDAPSPLDVHYSHSTDGGLSWSPEIDIAEDPLGSQRPFIAVQDSYVAVSWMGYKYSDQFFTGDYFYRLSRDNGETWDTSQVLTNTHFVWSTEISLRDSIITASWLDKRFGWVNNAVMARLSIDRGNIWTDEQRISADTSSSTTPSSATYENKIHIIWGDALPLGRGLYYRQNDLLSSVEIDPNELLPLSNFLIAYPNPFNSTVRLKYCLVNGNNGSIKIYNINGELIRDFTLIGKEGYVDWDARNKDNHSLASGVYLVKLSASVGCSTVKLLYLK